MAREERSIELSSLGRYGELSIPYFRTEQAFVTAAHHMQWTWALSSLPEQFWSPSFYNPMSPLTLANKIIWFCVLSSFLVPLCKSTFSGFFKIVILFYGICMFLEREGIHSCSQTALSTRNLNSNRLRSVKLWEVGRVGKIY